MINLSDNKPLSELYEDLGREWVDLNAAADILEDTKSSFLSEKMQYLIASGMPVNRAESQVKSSLDWKNRVLETVEARRKANLAKVQMEVVKMRHTEQQSEEATERVKARL